MPRMSEHYGRWFLVALLSAAVLVAGRPWGKSSTIETLRPSSARNAENQLHTKQALAELTDLGVGPDGQGLPPEDSVIQEQKALLEGLEARP